MLTELSGGSQGEVVPCPPRLRQRKSVRHTRPLENLDEAAGIMPRPPIGTMGSESGLQREPAIAYHSLAAIGFDKVGGSVGRTPGAASDGKRGF